MSETLEEKIITALPPFMKRRMAMLALAGVKFVWTGLGHHPDVWMVIDPKGHKAFGGLTSALAAQINTVWRQALEDKMVEPDYGHYATWVIGDGNAAQ